MPAFQPDIESRFWSKVNKNGPILNAKLGACWIWTGQINNNGYGVFRISRPRRRSVFAHRQAYEFIHGSIPDGVDILHDCDNPPCVRHTYPGNVILNAGDMASRGRTNTTVITPEDARTILDYFRLHPPVRGDFAKVARNFGVNKSTVAKLVRGVTHKYLSI